MTTKNQDENPIEDVKLKKVLSVWDVTGYIICIIIGSGIFISPKGKSMCIKLCLFNIVNFKEC